VILQMRRDFAVDHVALALANGSHVGGDVAGYDAEARAPAREMRDPGAPNFVFAGEAGDVGAGAADPLTLDHGGAPARLRHVPSQQPAACRCRGSGCQIVPVQAWGSPSTIALSNCDERGQTSAIAAYAQFPVDGLVFGGSCSEVFLDPGRHVFRPRLPMTDRRLPGACGRVAHALRTAVGCWWPLIVLRCGSTPQEGYCDKGITHCNCAHRPVLRVR